MASVQTQPASAVVGQHPLPISVAVITLNEEQNLARCLESVRGLAAEIAVLDSGSVDRTGQIARDFGAIFETQPWQGYVAQKNAGLRQCTQPWVLCLDADEALSPELARSIRQLFATGQPNENGFWMSRRTFYLGGWIHHAWSPEWKLRLVRREGAEWRGGDVHERLEVRGATGRIPGDLLHYPPFRDFHDHVAKAIKYARIAADSYAATGRRAHLYDLLLSPAAVCFKHLIVKQSWRDGWRGWLILIAKLVNVLAKYAFLLEKQHTAGDSARRP
jgi:glycosyltransferase involved in cell wall biosynthesis